MESQDLTRVIQMKLNVKAMVCTLAILWGAVFLIMGIANLIWPTYGEAFFKLLASVYPGYRASGSVADLVVGILYAVLDAAVGALLFCWIYNGFVDKLGSSR